MNSIAKALPVDVKSVEKLHIWNKRVLSTGGIWPLEPTHLKFYMSYAYFVGHEILAISDLVSVFGDMSLMIANLLETSIDAMVGVKMMVIRHTNLLEKVLKEVQKGASAENYRDQAEMKLYLAYNTVGQIFFKITSIVAFATCFLYHFKPLEDILKSVLHNETITFILPYRMRLFFDITDAPSYALLYLSQTPMFYYHYFHPMSICFLCTLIVHVAGEMSVLAHRIRNIKLSDFSKNNNNHNGEINFSDIVVKHYNIIWTATAINDIFNAVLLEEFVISTMLLGLTSYSLITTPLKESMFEYFFVVNYIAAIFILILIDCITGEYLIHESANVQNAYYESKWYEMPSKCGKQLSICMARAQNPLQLTAGRFYVLSLSRFSGVLKTAIAYISMLRTIS